MRCYAQPLAWKHITNTSFQFQSTHKESHSECHPHGSPRPYGNITHLMMTVKVYENAHPLGAYKFKYILRLHSMKCRENNVICSVPLAH